MVRIASAAIRQAPIVVSAKLDSSKMPLASVKIKMNVQLEFMLVVQELINRKYTFDFPAHLSSFGLLTYFGLLT